MSLWWRKNGPNDVPTRPATFPPGLTNMTFLVGPQPTSVYPRLGGI